VLSKPIASDPEFHPSRRLQSVTHVGQSADKRKKTMSKTSRHQRIRTGVHQATAIAAAVATLPILHSVSSTKTSSNLEGDTPSAAALKSGLDLKIKSGEVTKEQIRQIFDLLHAQKDIIPGSLWHTLPGSLRSRFDGHTITNIPYVTAVMQQLGLLRHWGRNISTTWQVIDQSFFEEVVSDLWFERSLYNQAKFDALIDEFAQAKEQLEKFSSASPEPSLSAESTAEPDQALMVQVAGLLDDIEQLRHNEQLSAQTIANLERKLAEPPKVTAADVANYLASLRASKT
jgi:RNAse (barnase) inhibitor barstar